MRHKWSNEKPKLDNARRLRGIYFIDLEDKEFKETIKNARKKLETPMAPAMPCKTNEFKTRLACILEASESTSLRMEESLPNYHEDHIAGKGVIHCSTTILYTNLFPCLKQWRYLQLKQQWIKNGRNWKRFRRGTWRRSEVKKRWSMKSGRRAQKLTLPHWWTSVIWRMPNWRQSTKNTKVELYSQAIFTEQGSSASQMTAAKIMDIRTMTERGDPLLAQMKFVLHLTRFTNVGNLEEWSMIWIMLILFPQEKLENLGVECGESQKQIWSDRWSKEQGCQCTFCVVGGSLSFEECWIGEETP